MPLRYTAFVLAMIASAAEPLKVKLSPDNQKQLDTVTIKALQSEVAISRLNDAYQKELAKRTEAAQAAVKEHADLMRKLQALMPKCPLSEQGEYVCSEEIPEKKEKGNSK